ncbi:hypothetical protein, partial [Ralstonia pseudosolanacearum]|uniref:hypothetical protein n=1 Tax=Ralstonia pseudosolanacearum TaxID=1310165 RepID=UPI00339B7599
PDAQPWALPMLRVGLINHICDTVRLMSPRYTHLLDHFLSRSPGTPCDKELRVANGLKSGLESPKRLSVSH